jgi:hypothetical protein
MTVGIVVLCKLTWTGTLISTCRTSRNNQVRANPLHRTQVACIGFPINRNRSIGTYTARLQRVMCTAASCKRPGVDACFMVLNILLCLLVKNCSVSTYWFCSSGSHDGFLLNMNQHVVYACHWKIPCALRERSKRCAGSDEVIV